MVNRANERTLLVIGPEAEKTGLKPLIVSGRGISL